MSLAAKLRARIAQSGPMSVADYMGECLLDPEHGYYTTRDPFGAAGDFTTAPEISQMFGELVGLCLAQGWMDQGSPAAIVLAELGPGRGTLMADILRATRGVPGFHDALRVVLVEASEALRTRQQATLAGYGVTWADRLEDVPPGPIFLVANEFFDALPVRQFQRDDGAWRERQVGLADDALTFGLGGPVSLTALDRFAEARDGDLVELRPAGEAVMAEIDARIAASGGAALIIDYGDWHSLGDTLQAVAKHDTADPLADPGEADLTSHVDFEALAQAAPRLTHSRLTPQGVFLERLGITARAQALARRLEGEPLSRHVAAHRRLTHPDEMGTLFKILAFVPEGAPMLPGLET
ncbi:SAM-dependent methyltransferase [Maritimibacter sp. UBA3975]|uniref:class I SAM-dependent methyltransferase n=1 Tax=Maritimibacter sp. UBA3975 TaxID=1946833 RepID=UPI000C0B73BC|nr:SAM-dependent methyltransferase [Maritimibacter sp. UBA3975]MAM62527.1 methyltransferase [Maritimibacter sp.]